MEEEHRIISGERKSESSMTANPEPVIYASLWNALSSDAQGVAIFLSPQLSVTSESLEHLTNVTKDLCDLSNGLNGLRQAGVLEEVTYLQEIHERMNQLKLIHPESYNRQEVFDVPEELRTYWGLEDQVKEYIQAEEVVRQVMPNTLVLINTIEKYWEKQDTPLFSDQDNPVEDRNSEENTLYRDAKKN